MSKKPKDLSVSEREEHEYGEVWYSVSVRYSTVIWSHKNRYDKNRYVCIGRVGVCILL